MKTNKNVRIVLFIATLMPLLSFGNSYAAGYPDSSSNISMRGGGGREGGDREGEDRSEEDNRNMGNRNNQTNVYRNQGDFGRAHPGYDNAYRQNNVDNAIDAAAVGGAVNGVVDDNIIIPEQQQPMYVVPAP